MTDELAKDVQDVIYAKWNLRKGQKVPITTEVVLAGGAVELEAAVLYADLAQSSRLANDFDRRVAAKVVKAFLACSCRIIRACGGEITSFDGDRVMAVFIGDFKNSNSTRCSLQINYTVGEIIRPKLTAYFKSLSTSGFEISHGVGIDTGTIMAVRAGARGANDLVWIGRAPNLAAKLSDLRQSPYHTFISAAVYNRLIDTSKFGLDQKNMWEKCSWMWNGEKITVYRSHYHWKP